MGLLISLVMICGPILAAEEIGAVDIDRLSTPNTVETSIGTLKFFDGAPTPETVATVYDYLDTMRGVDAFLKGMPGASVQALMDGPRVIGADRYNKVMIMDELLNSNSLFLTPNTSTLYVTPVLDMKDLGPMILEVPPGMLGAFNDAWFRYLGDVGPFGPDEGNGGDFIVVPPGYDGDIPDGYYVVESPTYRVWVFMRGSIANGVQAGADNIKANLKVYPLSERENPAPTEFVSGSGEVFNTIHTNDYTFYEHLNEVIQYEPLDMLDPETRGLFASIGIEKGKEFAPDARMQSILTDAVAIANATARSIVWYPRVDGTMEGIQVYPDTNSAWVMAWVDKNVFFNGEDGQTMNSDARVMFHYPYTAVTPAMAVSIPGRGSDYAIALVDESKAAMDGSKIYKVNIPADPPADDFWALTLYDNQSRSQLQTSQLLPSVGIQTEGIRQNADGSFDIYFGPDAPAGYENNWLETVPGKGWFVALRMYGPTERWINKTWRPSEVLLVE